MIMKSNVRIGIIGDYDGRPSHLATEEALKHSAAELAIQIEFQWLSTDSVMEEKEKLIGFDGLWCAPGSPYKSMNGALAAIKYARVNRIPFLGTCGGFQHAVIEFGRNVLGISTLKYYNFNPYAENSYISALACSLVGQTRRINLDKNIPITRIFGAYEITEKYNCSFGLNKNFQDLLHKNGFKVIGTDENEEARLMILESNNFFIVSLFQPQLSSTYEQPHPLVTEFLKQSRQFSMGI